MNERRDRHRVSIRAYRFSLAIACFSGLLVLVLCGWLEGRDPTKPSWLLRVVSLVAGSGLGVAGSLLLATYLMPPYLARLLDAVASLEQAVLGTGKNDIHRREYVSYHLTRSEGKPLWRLVKYDFGASNFGHALYDSFVAEIPGSPARVNRYEIFGHRLRERLILDVRPLDSEDPVMIHTFPSGKGSVNAKVRAGISIHHDWDGNSMLSPVLLCDEDLEELLEQGIKADRSQRTVASSAWSSERIHEELHGAWLREAAKAGLSPDYLSVSTLLPAGLAKT